MLVALTFGMGASPCPAQDSAGIKTPPGRRKVELFPPPSSQPSSQPTSGPAERAARGPGQPIEIGGWVYRAEKSGQPRGGVPWELVVTPGRRDAESWNRGDSGWKSLPAPSTSTAQLAGDRLKLQKDDTNIPVIQIPEAAWKQWMAADLQQAVGIHYHELVTDDTARILYTLHKVPPDDADGRPPPAGSYKGRAGVRVEATLLAPLTFSLDQTILLRVDPLEKEKIPGRSEHELGHALASQEVFLDVLRGPQNWSVERCTGRRSRVEFYWKREVVGRSWEGCRNSGGRLATLRTTVVLVPPTRWAMLLPIPPERVTQKHLNDFNESLVHLYTAWEQADGAAQARFHATHGEYE
jgi:hypothetical protein